MRTPSEVDVIFRDDGICLLHDGETCELSYEAHQRWIVDGEAPSEVFAAGSSRPEPGETRGPESGATSFPLVVGEHLLLRPLGSGSFGEVFAAWDPLCGEQVAVKVLRRVDPWSLQAFKNEFRRIVSLAAVDGLVVPEELVEARGRWALVMRLVGGREIDAALREAAGAEGPLADEDRLRELTIDLVRTLVTLHSGGLIHMDLKPGNIRVDEGGRVCVLDFGLSRLRGRDRAETHFAGSPLYIAPEQLLRQPPTGAVDLYALGIMLYSAFTGEHPFRGAHDLMIARLEEPAPSLTRRRPEAGKLWAKIVAGLLHDRPAKRLGAEELLALFGARPPKSVAPPRLIGRESELADLRSGWRGVCEGVPSLVVLSGEPGVGKTELARAFGDELAEGSAAMVWGACYDRETVPYKTVDVLVEGLVDLLLGDPERLALARDLPALAGLARVAPALAAVLGEGAGEESDDRSGDGQPAAQGGRGEGLTALVSLVAERAPLLLVIDDAQWGDADSADLLAPLLASPSPGRVMIIFTVRARDWETSPFGRALESQIAKGLPRELARPEIGRLGAFQARAMLLACAPEAASEGAIAKVLELASGSPYLLSAYAQLLTGERGIAEVQGGDVIGLRLAELSEHERHVIDVIAVAGAPLELSIVLAAAGVEAPSRRTLAKLRAERVLTLDHRGVERRVAIAHGLIREGVLERLSAEEVRLLHADLAQAMLSRGAEDPGRIAQHLYSAGRFAEARELGLRGAAEAEEAGAYAQLAELLGLVLRADRDTRRDHERIKLRRARALMAAGRGGEAGEIYAAQVGADPAEVRAFRRAAVEAWMTVGQVERGLEVFRPLLRELRMPKLHGGVAGLARFLSRLAKIAAQGGRLRPAELEDPRAAERADTCWVGIKGLSTVEPVYALNLMADGLFYAAASGSRLRLGRAMGHLAALFGDAPGLRRHVPRWFDQLVEWSKDEPYLAATLPLWRSFRAHSEGELTRAREEGQRAMELLGELPEASWERLQAASCAARALRNQGEYVACAALARSQLRTAERCGDLYAQVLFRLTPLLAVLARGGQREVRTACDWIEEVWLPGRYTVQSFYVMVERCYEELARGDSSAAADRLSRGRWAYFRSGGEMISLMRVEWRLIQGRVLLALEGPPPRALTPVAKVIAQLRAAKTPEAVGNAELMAAALAARRGDRSDALAALRRAIQSFDSVGIAMEREAARLRSAELMGDTAEAEDALLQIRRLGAREPERWARVIAPGFSQVQVA